MDYYHKSYLEEKENKESFNRFLKHDRKTVQKAGFSKYVSDKSGNKKSPRTKSGKTMDVI